MSQVSHPSSSFKTQNKDKRQEAAKSQEADETHIYENGRPWMCGEPESSQLVQAQIGVWKTLADMPSNLKIQGELQPCTTAKCQELAKFQFPVLPNENTFIYRLNVQWEEDNDAKTVRGRHPMEGIKKKS